LKTSEELGEDLCVHCPLTEFGLIKVNTGPYDLCEGRCCEEAYANYIEQCEEE
jgi:hypothetical protein